MGMCTRSIMEAKAHPTSHQQLDLCTHQAAFYHCEGSDLQCFMLGLASMGKARMSQGMYHTQCLYRAGLLCCAWGLAPADPGTCSASPLQELRAIAGQQHNLLVVRSRWKGFSRSLCISCCRHGRRVSVARSFTCLCGCILEFGPQILHVSCRRSGGWGSLAQTAS